MAKAPPQRLIVGIAGASGVIYGIRALEILRKTGIETHLECTDGQVRAAVNALTFFARRATRREAVLRLTMPLVTALLNAEAASRKLALAASAFFSSTACSTFLMTPLTPLITARFRRVRFTACRARLIVDL